MSFLFFVYFWTGVGARRAINTVTRERKRSNQTHRLEEEQRPNIIPLGVDYFIQHAEPEPLLPVRVFGVVDTVLQMPVVLFHDGDRTSRHASRALLLLQVSTLPRKICFLSPSCRSKISWKRQQGSRRRAWMCSAPHAGNEVLPPPTRPPPLTRKKSTKQERLWEQQHRGGGGTHGVRRRGGVTSDVRSDLHPKPHKC